MQYLGMANVHKGSYSLASTHMCRNSLACLYSTLLSISIASGVLMLRTCHLDHLCVCVQKVYCGKMADWIRMSLGW